MIIAVVNQKGGVGKSTTAHSLAAGLALAGKKVLAVDLDPQGNLTYIMGGNADGAALRFMLGEITAADAVQHTALCDLLAASQSFSGADANLTETGKEYKLRECLEELPGYDYIVIDTPPALGVLSVNALVAADRCIIPAQADVLSLQGIGQLISTIQPVKRYCNKGLTIDGILLTRYSNRAVISRDVAKMAEDIAAKAGTRVYKATIRDAVAVRESQISRQSLFEYAPKAPVTEDYRAFIAEFLHGV